MKTKDWMKIGFGLFFGKFLAHMIEGVFETIFRCIYALSTIILDEVMKDTRESRRAEHYTITAKFINRALGKKIYPENPRKREETQNKIGFDIT